MTCLQAPVTAATIVMQSLYLMQLFMHRMLFLAASTTCVMCYTRLSCQLSA